MTTSVLPAPASATRATPRPARALARMLSLDDFEAAARRRLPRPIFGYVAGAAED
ncbi:alpha-hydroxy-acid oxidizing protein, partial [Achromobacter xylosoxidans]